MNCSEVTRRSIAKSVLGGDCETMGYARYGRRGITADDQRACGGRVDRDAALSSFDGARDVIGGGDRLTADCFQRGAIGMGAGIAADKCVIRR